MMGQRKITATHSVFSRRGAVESQVMMVAQRGVHAAAVGFWNWRRWSCA